MVLLMLHVCWPEGWRGWEGDEREGSWGGGRRQKGNGVEGGMHNMKHYLEHEEQRVYTILF